LLDFWGLLTRHWDGIVRILYEEDVFAPLLLRKALFDDKEHSCLFVAN